MLDNMEKTKGIFELADLGGIGPALARTDRIARIIDSPYHPYTQDGIRFTISERVWLMLFRIKMSRPSQKSAEA